MSNDELAKRIIIRRLGELCNYSEELSQELENVEHKILETVKLLQLQYLPKHSYNGQRGSSNNLLNSGKKD